jgi:uncharacterized membrane protein YqjE
MAQPEPQPEFKPDPQAKLPPELQAKTGLAESLATLLKHGLGLVSNRLELASLELAECRTALIKLAILIVLGLVVSLFALGYWSVLLVALTWDYLGWKILLIMASVFSLLAWFLLRSARAILRQGKLSMPATMAELRKDGQAFRGTMHE